MNVITILARNTYKEIIRDRILSGLVVFALLLIGLSLVLGQLSFAEQARISANFGFSAIHLSSIVLAVFIGSTLVAKEIEKQTILTLLARPITRFEFLLGKFFGLSFAIVTVILGLTLVICIVFYGLNVPLRLPVLIALWGIFLESLIMLSVVMVFGMLTRPLLAVCFSVGIYLIGHWLDSLLFFTSQSDSEMFGLFGRAINSLLPNLERYNWRSLVVYEEVLPLSEVGLATANAFLWVLMLLLSAGLIFRRKDFV